MSSKEHGKVSVPTVSVVMPVHDMPMTLVRRALRSVHRQNYPGVIETILWDDGSRNPYRRDAYAALASWPDNTSVPAGHRVVVAHRTQEQRGIARSRNDAVARTGAQWLLWLDGDDELPADAISSLVAAVARSENPYAIGQCRVVYPWGVSEVHSNVPYLTAWRRQRASQDDPLAHVVFNTHGGLVRRDLFRRTGGFDPRFSHAELVDWFRRLFRALPTTDAFDVLSTVTYVHHKRSGSQSSDRARVVPQRIEALQRYASAAGIPPAELDAPMVNVATGCPEYKRVEREPDSAGGELVDVEPARP
jgi:glycosyltransferase involved in cell wall biosynthesis